MRSFAFILLVQILGLMVDLSLSQEGADSLSTRRARIQLRRLEGSERNLFLPKEKFRSYYPRRQNISNIFTTLHMRNEPPVSGLSQYRYNRSRRNGTYLFDQRSMSNPPFGMKLHPIPYKRYLLPRENTTMLKLMSPIKRKMDMNPYVRKISINGTELRPSGVISYDNARKFDRYPYRKYNRNYFNRDNTRRFISGEDETEYSYGRPVTQHIYKIFIQDSPSFRLNHFIDSGSFKSKSTYVPMADGLRDYDPTDYNWNYTNPTVLIMKDTAKRRPVHAPGIGWRSMPQGIDGPTNDTGENRSAEKENDLMVRLGNHSNESDDEGASKGYISFRSGLKSDEVMNSAEGAEPTLRAAETRPRTGVYQMTSKIPWKPETSISSRMDDTYRSGEKYETSTSVIEIEIGYRGGFDEERKDVSHEDGRKSAESSSSEEGDLWRMMGGNAGSRYRPTPTDRFTSAEDKNETNSMETRKTAKPEINDTRRPQSEAEAYSTRAEEKQSTAIDIPSTEEKKYPFLWRSFPTHPSIQYRYTTPSPEAFDIAYTYPLSPISTGITSRREDLNSLYEAGKNYANSRYGYVPYYSEYTRMPQSSPIDSENFEVQRRSFPTSTEAIEVTTDPGLQARSFPLKASENTQNVGVTTSELYVNVGSSSDAGVSYRVFNSEGPNTVAITEKTPSVIEQESIYDFVGKQVEALYGERFYGNKTKNGLRFGSLNSRRVYDALMDTYYAKNPQVRDQFIYGGYPARDESITSKEAGQGISTTKNVDGTKNMTGPSRRKYSHRHLDAEMRGGSTQSDESEETTPAVVKQ